MIEEIKKDFPLLENRNIAYLDSGATTQKPKEVIEAIKKYYENSNANPHRGAYSLSIEATEQYENTRTKIAEFINAKHKEEIIFSKNATESLNLIAYSYGMDNLKKDDEVVISIMEHHSNLVPWQKVTKATGSKLNYMYINENYEISDEEIESKITDKTKIVGITHVSNVLGTINNVKKIIKYAHKKGAIVIVDASQSIPHMKIDVQELDADFLVFSGHKMLAPLGIGVLYGKREILNNMTPFLMGGDMIEYVYEQETTFAPLPNKFEAGTQNVEGVIGLGAAIDYIQKIGYDKIQEKENEIIKVIDLEEQIESILWEIDFLRNKKGLDYSDIAIVYPYNKKKLKNGKTIYFQYILRKALEEAKIPYMVAEDEITNITKKVGITISNIYGIKNLEYKAVIFCELEMLYNQTIGDTKQDYQINDFVGDLNKIYLAINASTSYLKIITTFNEDSSEIIKILIKSS